MLKKRPHYKSSVLFMVCIVLLLFFLWKAPSTEGPPIPSDDNHSGVEDALSCMKECHIFKELLEENNNHPPKAECLACHSNTPTPLVNNISSAEP